MTISHVSLYRFKPFILEPNLILDVIVRTGIDTTICTISNYSYLVAFSSFSSRDFFFCLEWKTSEESKVQ
jgi:hypothetical protein